MSLLSKFALMPAFLVLAGTSQGATIYTVDEIGYGYATGINASGHVAGQTGTVGGFVHNPTRTDYFVGQPYAINNGGTMVGGMPVDPQTYFGYSSLALRIHEIEAHGSGFGHYLDSPYSAVATGVNNFGTAVGVQFVGGGTSAFRWNGDTLENLGTFGAESAWAYGINDAGAIVGTLTNVGGDELRHPFLQSGNDLLVLGPGAAYAVNNAGQFTGYMQVGGERRAFLYGGSGLVNIGTLGGLAAYGQAVNNSGTVVGTSFINATTAHAFIYSGGVMTDLNSLIPTGLGITLTDATGINDLGQIAANGVGGIAYLVTPVSQGGETPEPGTWLMVMTAVGMMWVAPRGAAKGAVGAAQRKSRDEKPGTAR